MINAKKSTIEELGKFWETKASEIAWFKKWDKAIEWKEPIAEWFKGGKINASYSCIDIHVKNGLKDKVAYHFESENGEAKNWTYGDMYDTVN